MTPRLASATVTARLTGQGRATVSAKVHHLIVDSPLTLGGPNEEVNPIDLLLGSLASHGAFVCERAAQENGIRLSGIAVRVDGEFDPRGARGEPVEPQLRSIRVQLELAGATEAEADFLANAMRTRCVIYTTLVRAVPIEVEIAQKPSWMGSRLEPL